MDDEPLPGEIAIPQEEEEGDDEVAPVESRGLRVPGELLSRQAKYNLLFTEQKSSFAHLYWRGGPPGRRPGEASQGAPQSQRMNPLSPERR